MRTVFASVLLFATAASAMGCSFALRSPDMYRDDTAKVLATKNEEIKACYDGAVKTTPGAAGKVTVKFKVEKETGKFMELAVDKANTTASDAIATCVTTAIANLSLTPGDKNMGDATFSYEFTAPPAPVAAK